MELCDSGRRKISVLTGVRITRVILEKIYMSFWSGGKTKLFMYMGVRKAGFHCTP